VTAVGHGHRAARRAVVVAIACLGVWAGLLVTASRADATPTCAYDAAAKTLTVNLPAAFDDPLLSISGGNIVVVYAFGIPVNCSGSATPPAIDTNTIFVNGSGAQGNRVFIRRPEEFLNGELENLSGAQEIEIFVNLMNGADSRLRIIAGDGGASIRRGADGINPNATSGELAPDADIFPSQVQGIELLGGAGNDTIGGQGGAGTGAALTERVSLEGQDGADNLTGGAGNDGLDGGAGNDNLAGVGGNDGFLPGAGNDSVAGGSGTDSANYAGVSTPPGVSVDLAVAGPQSTGASGSDSLASIENLSGTSFADVLRGNGAPNTLRAFQGNDTLAGRGGVDSLEAGEGGDSLNVRDSAADTADCGPQADTVTADLPGIDTLIECESRLFPDVDPPETTITAGPKKKLKLKRSKRKAAATFAFSSDEAGAVFECSLDGRPFGGCTSPLTVKVKKGLHDFAVRARDEAGNVDQSPAPYSFKVKKKKRRKK
jgi:Ca2+-binding RTX toxin-like protein